MEVVELSRDLMGLFLDIYIEYCIRVIIRLVRRWNAKSWSTVTAKITASRYRAGGFGCAVADISYKYEVNGDIFTETNAVPFLFTRAAEEYAEHYSPGSELVIRVRPGKPESSLVREDDLYRLEHGFQLQTK